MLAEPLETESLTDGSPACTCTSKTCECLIHPHTRDKWIASQRDRDTVPGALLRSGVQAGGELNPGWVEWLMGCPIRFTE